jgi:hypothetical protein
MVCGRIGNVLLERNTVRDPLLPKLLLRLVLFVLVVDNGVVAAEPTCKWGI